MEHIEGGGFWFDVVAGLSCGATIVLAATPAWAFAIATGDVCITMLVGYAAGIKESQ